MKITFLGSSHGVPSAERFCSCAMLEVGDAIYLIDAGAPVAELLMRYGKDVNKLKAIFTTHCHSDHTAGLLGISNLCSWYFKNASFDICITKQALAQAICSCTEAMAAPIAADRVRFRSAFAGEVYNDGTLKVTYIPTRHCEPDESYAVLLEAEGKRVLFTGDLSPKLENGDFPTVALNEQTELVVCEMAHFAPEHIKPYMSVLKTKRLIFNHVYPLAKLELIEAMAGSGEYPYAVCAAADGDVVEL